MLLTGVMAIFGASGCPDGDIINPNNVPNITTSSLGTAIEGQDINTIINGTDADSDPLTYSLVSAPAGASITPIDATSAKLNWTPTHVQADVAQSFTIRVDDGKDTSDRVYSVTPENRSTMNGIVNEMGSGASPIPLVNINVTVGSQSTTTDAGGYWEINNIPDGTHAVMFKDTNNIYVTYKAGNAETNKSNEDAGKTTGLENRLLPEAYYNFLEATSRSSRSGGEINKFDPDATIIFDIYQLNAQGSVPVPNTNIELVEDMILNVLSGRHGYNFTTSNIILHNTTPLIGQPADNHIKVYWNNEVLGGNNGVWPDGTRILSGSASANTSDGANVWLNEFLNLFTNGSDSNLYASGRNDPSSESLPTLADDIIDEFHIYREAGNRSDYFITLDLDDRDKEPVGTVMNKSFNPLSSTYSKSATISVDVENQELDVF